MATSDSSNQIHCVLLLLDVVGPDTENVAATIHIDVVVNSGDVSGKCLLIVGFELFFDLHRMLILISHLLDHFRLLYLL